MNKKDEERMFGESIDEIKASIINFKNQDPLELNLYAMSILSDSQELLQRSDINKTEGETLRQFMNKAKYIISESSSL